MPDQIFISYRRDDAAYVTGHINDLLRKAFGGESVFTDVDNIALGVDFRAVLDESVSQCQVLLAVIGDNWLTVKNRDDEPRLNDPADFVRIEIESALKRDIPVIPLLVSGAKMPLEEDLPDSLKDLAFRNGIQIRPAPDFNLDMDRLIRNLRAYLESMRTDVGDDKGLQPASDTNLGDETVQQRSHAESESRQDEEAKQNRTSKETILVGEEESVRKQVELGIGHHPPKKRWATLSLVIAILTVAAGSWYYVVQNPEQMQAVLTAIQTSDSAAEENSATSEVVEADDVDGTANTDESTFGAPTSFTAAAIAGADEASTVDPTVSATTVDGTEASPELVADSTNENSESIDALDEPVDDAEVELIENTETENADAVGMVDGEVILTPGTQRRADVSRLLSEGVSLAATGEHEAAIQKFDAAIQLDADTAFLYKQRGAAFRALGQFAMAVRDYDEAIQLDGEDVNAYFSRGVSHFALQDYAATVADYDEVIRLDPELADAYSKRANAHEAMGNVGEAARDRSVAAVFESNRENPR
jgi:tetratricopeptide (TPR) repeat protein